jgi:dTDP-4-amino-4,6-dideoxygalactose transaminase
MSWIANKPINTKRVNELLEYNIKTNQFTNGGHNTIYLEKLIRDKLKISNDKSIIVVNNATSALHCIIYALKLFLENPDSNYNDSYTNLDISLKTKNESKWVTQDFTFPPSAQGPLSNVIIMDIDNGGGLSLEELKNYHKLNDIRGIIVTNIFGNCVDINKYTNFAKDNNIFLIFDNAATSYTFYNGSNACNYGNASIISFHHTKPIGFGEGGAIIIDKRYEQCCRRIINFGIDNNSGLTWKPIGNNYKMSEISAVYIIQYLEDYFDKIVKHHTKLYNQVISRINENIEYKLYPNFADKNSDILISCICYLLDNSNEKLKELQNKNINARKYYYPLTYKPNSKTMYDNILCYPCNLDIMTIEDL